MFRALKFRIFKRPSDRFKILLHRVANVRKRTLINQPRSSPLYLRSRTDRALPSKFVSTRRMHLLKRARLELRDRRARRFDSRQQKPSRLKEETSLSKNREPVRSSFKHPDFDHGLYKSFWETEKTSLSEIQRKLEYRFDLRGLGSTHGSLFRVSDDEPCPAPRSSESRTPTSLGEAFRSQRSDRLDRYVRLYADDCNRALDKSLDLCFRKTKASDGSLAVKEVSSLISFLRAKEPPFSRFRLFRLYCREIERTFKKSETDSSFRASLGLVEYVSTSRMKLDFSLRAAYLAILVFRQNESCFSVDSKSNRGGFFRTEHSTKTTRIETYLTKNVVRTFVVSFSENVLYESNPPIFKSARRGARPFDLLKTKENERLFHLPDRLVRSKNIELRWTSDARSQSLVARSSSDQRREATPPARVERSRFFPRASEMFSSFKNLCIRKNALDLLARCFVFRSQCSNLSDFSSVFRSKTKSTIVFIEKNTGHDRGFFARNAPEHDRKNVRGGPKRTFAVVTTGRSLLRNLEGFSFREIGAGDRNGFSRIFDEAYDLDALSFTRVDASTSHPDVIRDTRALFSRFPSNVFEHEIADGTLLDLRSMSSLKKVTKSLASATQKKLVDRLTRSLYVLSYRHRAAFEPDRLFELDSRLKILAWRWSVRRHNNKSKGWIKAKYFIRFQDRWLFGTVERKDGVTASGLRFVYVPSVFQIVFSFGKNRNFKRDRL